MRCPVSTAFRTVLVLSLLFSFCSIFLYKKVISKKKRCRTRLILQRHPSIWILWEPFLSNFHYRNIEQILKKYPYRFTNVIHPILPFIFLHPFLYAAICIYIPVMFYTLLNLTSQIDKFNMIIKQFVNF